MLKIIIFFSSVVALGTGLKCFEDMCEGDDCDNSNMRFWNNITECSHEFNYDAPGWCTTIVLKDYHGLNRVMRSCARFYGANCPYGAKCDYCNLDLCNSAPPTNMNIVVVISTIFLVLLSLCKF
ncbi:uncharacterized protein LOC126884529 isoform X1 [Diabrotica virgifera virgifera]|uniref:Protein sleepless n=1 Tax=Diabrotica virgifera virgifera TaxID=50390 RepID=A0ABM5K8B5_DIAVI|nr:uncharacterized protein LOC126884529 isoform X1 [Diabrotica virgifera virgifera]